MHYKAITTLKRSDTEGRISRHTLDQYVRDDLALQLMKALKPALPIDYPETNPVDRAHSSTVDFTTELFILKPQQWQQLKESLRASLDSLPIDQQRIVRRLIADIETRQLNALDAPSAI